MASDKDTPTDDAPTSDSPESTAASDTTPAGSGDDAAGEAPPNDTGAKEATPSGTGAAAADEDAATPLIPGGGPEGMAGRRAWLWAVGVVVLALATATGVFVAATHNSPAAPAASVVTTTTASPTVAATLSAPASMTPAPSPSPSPTTAPTATPTPVAAAPTPAELAAILFPASGTECGPPAQYATKCPMDADLIHAAAQWITVHNPSAPAPLCRCPVPWEGQPTYVQNDGDLPAGLQGNTAYAAVDVHLTFSSTQHETVVVLFLRQPDGSWRAHDTNCEGLYGGSAGGTGNLLSNSGSTTCMMS